MLFAPHRDGWDWLLYVTGNYYNRHQWDDWPWFPIFWIEPGNPILWGNFVGQTAFVAVFAAVIVNIRRSRNKL
jgi:hypothetical protein